jgi:hypothetical protein
MNSIKCLASYLLKNSEMFQEQCKLYINNLLFNIRIISKFSLANQNIIFQFMLEYLKSQNAINLIECDKLLSIIGYYNECYQNYYCCEEHQTFYGEKKNKSVIKTPFEPIIKIIGLSAKSNDYIYIKMLHLLVIKNKPCLIKYILENIFINNLTANDIKTTEKNKFVKYLVKNNILNILLFLLSTYVYPDIISQIITIFSILSVQSKPKDNNNFFYKENIINYIANSVLPIYVRIKNSIEMKTEEKSNIIRTKTLAASEIVFPAKSNEFNLHLTNVDYSSEDDDIDEYNDLTPTDKRFRKLNTEKIQMNYRKRSEDNFQNNTFSLRNISKMDINDEKNNKQNNIKKTLEFNSDSEREDSLDEIKAYRSPRKLKSSIVNIKNFNSISEKKITDLFNIESMYEKSKLEYMKLNPILDKLNQTKLSFFIQTILDSLLNWLKNDFNNYVIKIILIFFKTNKIESIHIYKFIETLDLIINTNIHSKNNILSKKIFSLDFFLWYTDILFENYLGYFRNIILCSYIS